MQWTGSALVVFWLAFLVQAREEDEPPEQFKICTGRLEEEETWSCPDVTADKCATTYTAVGGGAYMQCGRDGKLCLHSSFCDTTTTTTLPGFVLIDDDGLWVKINQWTQGLYERQSNAYGTVRTSGPGDGKLDDGVINALMMANKLRGPSGNTYNVFKVTAKEASLAYYLRVKDRNYTDTKRNFDFRRYSTYQAIGDRMPQNLETGYKDLNIAGIFDAYHFGARQSCNRYFMGHDSHDDCYKADGGRNTNKRCFSGGYYCHNKLRRHHPPLLNVQMFLKIAEKGQALPGRCGCWRLGVLSPTMKWQPLDRDLSFAGTWNWLPQKDEEELLGPTTFDEAFRELLDQHRRADAHGCWESAELPHSAETASAAGSVATTAVGSTSPVHFFIGDHDAESTSSLMQSRELFETYNIGSDCASLCESSTSLDYDADWLAGSQPDATVSEPGEPGAAHSISEDTCPGSLASSMPSSRSGQSWSNDREVSWAVDAKFCQLPAIACVEQDELEHWSRCILQESETWMNWMHQGQGMPSQILWESLLHELCELGESSRAKAYLLAGAELGCNPSCWTRLAGLCGVDAEPPVLLRSASESSIAPVESPMSLEPPSASLLEATPGGEEEEFVSESLRRTAERAQERQVLELDALILPVPRRAHGADFPLHSLRATGCTSTGSKQASRMSPAIWADLDEQERLLQELGRAGYIQKRIHRKLHVQAAQIGDRELLSLGDLCFSKQFAEVERLAGRASTNDCFQ
ncbi:unnamed protein product [Symbiodinium necroappetens]|uniref:Uncharacterized protein n=1 Tax=Symbiodinium necroappetens TaxID=1628268 RepID=A0A812QT81_9DINO|nr:unnamed protein product [Symbiodinium necroappetens]